MVEHEAVYLGVQFQVGGKWCPFVAVETIKRNREEKEREAEDWEFLEDEMSAYVATGNTNPVFGESYREYSDISSDS